MNPTAAIGQPGDPAAVRSVTFDDVAAIYVVDGVLTMRPETFFPETPRQAWDHLCTTAGELVMSAGGLLVRIAGTTVLIDAGVGTATKSFAFGGVDCGSMLEVLDSLEVRPEDIDVLAVTHLHFDHAGWAFADGARTFPNARYAFSAQEWAPHAAGHLGEGEVAPRHVISQLASGSADFELFDDGDEIVPGVRALVTPGHTPGHTSYVITSHTGRRLVAFGDAFHSSTQVTHPDWMSIADTDATAVIATRHRLLDRLSEPDTFGFGCHFGDQPFGRVVADASGQVTWEPIPSAVLAPPPR
ncbi:MBL fold metallo-hydrolase [Mycolicibacterium stellerae]|uniref:MBL fold metallo-hydrolase n=1 Tax=Mycolicibacterium stellerae TaxID=2358193 RepID=UPI000F0BB8FE|nr:MBL fold metallo-hydrolase [Mycolicibacterium stellerae]